MRKMTSFFKSAQPPRNRIQVEQHEEMKWKEEEDVMTDMKVDPHDWLKVEKSRDIAIRLRRASCQRTAWRKLQKEKEEDLRALSLTFREWLVERAILEWSKSVLVTMASVEGLVITA